MTRRPLTMLAVLAALAAALAACSPSGGAAAGPSPSPSRDAGRELELSRQFAECARDHGYPDTPDPEIQNGRVVWPADNPNLKDQLGTLAEQVPECKAIMNQLSAITGQSRGGQPSAEEMVKLRAFAKCMREQGIDGFPDPTADGDFPLAGTPLEGEGKSERVLTAVEACKHLVDEKIAVS